MVTDRVSTCGLLVVVSHLYPKYNLAFILLIVLDITSHWFHVQSVSAHHKSKEALEHRNALLQWYYSIYPLFGYCCVGTEAFYILLYVLHHFPNPIVHQVCHAVRFFSCAADANNLLQPLCFLYCQICFFGCMPACILKQLVNVVQLTSAAEALAAVDAADANADSKASS